MYWNQAAALIRHFISSFFFLSSFQTLKFFVTLFSGAVRPRRLKLGTHVDSGQMYPVTGIRLLLLIHPFISSFFFLCNYQTLKIFVTFFSGTVRPRRLKLGTQVDSGQMYRVYRNQAAAAYSSIIHFLSLQFSNIKICGQWVYVWCILESGCCCLFVPLFFLSLQFSNIKIFLSHLSQEL